jgi:hypothetical protein
MEAVNIRRQDFVLANYFVEKSLSRYYCYIYYICITLFPASWSNT